MGDTDAQADTALGSSQADTVLGSSSVSNAQAGNVLERYITHSERRAQQGQQLCWKFPEAVLREHTMANGDFAHVAFSVGSDLFQHISYCYHRWDRATLDWDRKIRRMRRSRLNNNWPQLWFTHPSLHVPKEWTSPPEGREVFHGGDFFLVEVRLEDYGLDDITLVDIPQRFCQTPERHLYDKHGYRKLYRTVSAITAFTSTWELKKFITEVFVSMERSHMRGADDFIKHREVIGMLTGVKVLALSLPPGPRRDQCTALEEAIQYKSWSIDEGFEWSTS